MIGTPPKPPGGNADDAHAAIRAEADKARSLPPGGVSNAQKWPALETLLAAGRAAVESSVPASFDHMGRCYFLRVRLAMQLDIFETPGAAAPLVRGASLSDEGFGHAPGH